MTHVKPFGLLLAFALALSSVVIAQDRPRSRAQLVKPWSDLSTLSEDQKQQIIDIHAEALDAMRKIRDKERADIMAILSEENKQELAALQQQQRAEQRARRAAGAAAASGTDDGDKDD